MNYEKGSLFSLSMNSAQMDHQLLFRNGHDDCLRLDVNDLTQLTICEIKTKPDFCCFLSTCARIPICASSRRYTAQGYARTTVLQLQLILHCPVQCPVPRLQYYNYNHFYTAQCTALG